MCVDSHIKIRSMCRNVWFIHIYFFIDKSNCIYFLACLPPSECILFIYTDRAMGSSRNIWFFFFTFYPFAMNGSFFLLFGKFSCVYCFMVCRQQLTKFGSFSSIPFVVIREKGIYMFVIDSVGDWKP